MSDYYVEIFLGISIGAFIMSLVFVISLIRRKTSTIKSTELKEDKKIRLTSNRSETDIAM